MTDLLRHVRNVRQRPGMYLEHDSGFDEFVAYFQGHDDACGSLVGFREFLVLRLDGGDNLGWPALMRVVALGEARRPLTPDEQQAALGLFFDVLTEFLAEVQAGGLPHILHEYHTWLRKQSWYKADLQRMGQWPAPDVMDANEAAAALGRTRRALFESIGTLGLRPLRRGPDVVFRRRDVERAAGTRSDGGKT